MIEDAVVALFYVCLGFVAVVASAILVIVFIAVPFVMLVALPQLIAVLSGCRCEM
jgi:hypothetical protein